MDMTNPFSKQIDECYNTLNKPSLKDFKFSVEIALDLIIRAVPFFFQTCTKQEYHYYQLELYPQFYRLTMKLYRMLILILVLKILMILFASINIIVTFVEIGRAHV